MREAQVDEAEVQVRSMRGDASGPGPPGAMQTIADGCEQGLQRRELREQREQLRREREAAARRGAQQLTAERDRQYELKVEARSGALGRPPDGRPTTRTLAGGSILQLL